MRSLIPCILALLLTACGSTWNKPYSAADPGPKHLLQRLHRPTQGEGYRRECGELPASEYDRLFEQRRAEWNRPVQWPLLAIVLVLGAAIWPAWRGYRLWETAAAC